MHARICVCTRVLEYCNIEYCNIDIRPSRMYPSYWVPRYSSTGTRVLEYRYTCTPYPWIPARPMDVYVRVRTRVHTVHSAHAVAATGTPYRYPWIPARPMDVYTQYTVHTCTGIAIDGVQVYRYWYSSMGLWTVDGGPPMPMPRGLAMRCGPHVVAWLTIPVSGIPGIIRYHASGTLRTRVRIAMRVLYYR